ncbi:PadR family transcriptional regulator [Saccharothrix australiensis]|uniref:PadR family transcriptional regulator n=1 Tax=Saccharothrix australiensis TaxID=2072 RepID=A0A495W4C3_9PSEU|nr:PadR family transcriptional regulator [Saccharothrix australiensis]RKT55625.1 PadR family transcriptional regulator [Saccharothrix australiensis]
MSLRFAVLGLLAIHEASGYELAKHFETTLPEVWFARNNQLYAELAKLTADGYAEVVEEGPRGRRVYAATGAGRVELSRWLVDEEPDRNLRSETALRDFLTLELPRDQALKVLHREIDFLTSKLEQIGHLLQRMAGLVPDHDIRALSTERRRLLAEARLAWAREAVRRIERRDA